MSDTSLLDPLTGAYTRATFNENLRVSVEQAMRHNSPCSLLLFDLDHFKSINDAFGHARGDEALVEVARRVQKTTRDSDMFFRYGGDEFVLLLPNTSKAEAVQLADRLLESISGQPVGHDAALILSISVGVATFPEDATDENTLFEKADARNYEAKRRGRARVIAEDSSTAPELPFAEISRIVERDDALKITQNFLTAITEQKRGVLSVVGAPGTGRSCLLAEVEKRARLQGFEVIALHGSPRLKHKPYGVLTRGLSQFSFAALERVAFDELDMALYRHLANSGRDRMLISVDDMPDLDWGTLDLLRQLVSHASILILGLMYASDPDHARIFAPFWSPVSEHIALSPLSTNGLRVWLRMLMQWEPPEDFIAWLAKETHGLPHDVERLIKYLLKQGALTKLDSGWVIRENYRADGAEGISQGHRQLTTNNLPAALTSFVGRESELKEIRRLLATTRLLTVVGPGGMGKTRLTLQAAKEMLGGFNDGVWFIELAPVTDPSMALYTIASVLGVQSDQSRPLLDILNGWLSDKELLLILDNCEHLIDLCAQFAHGVLSKSANVRILASSRESFDIAGEMVYRLPALESPGLQAGFPIEQLMQYEAARLFVERAMFATSTFSVDEEAASLITQICRQLDGIPLAIELAAARLRTLRLEEIASGLNNRFGLLTLGNRAAAPRHQTLRSLIDWSYDMLPEAERWSLQRLSVFAGGWTLEAAEAICDDPKILDPLSRLVDKSLVAVEYKQSDDTRYYLLETIRQYAHEKLLEAENSESIRQQHLTYFVYLVERAEPNLRAFDMVLWLDRLEDELDNIRAALEWGLKSNVETVLRLASALLWFWHIHNHKNEATDWLEQGLDHEATERGEKPLWPERALLRGKALNAASLLLRNSEQRIALLEEALKLFHELGMQGRQGAATALRTLGVCELEKGHNKQARVFVEESLSIFMEIREPFDIAECLNVLVGLAMNEGDFERARGLQEEALALRKEIGDKDGTAYALYTLGRIAHSQNEVAQAQTLYEESLALFRETGNRTWVAEITGAFADLVSTKGDYKKAFRLIEEGLALAKDMDDKYGLAHLMLNLGDAVRFQGDYDRASQLYEETLTLSRRMDANNFIASALYGKAEVARSKNDFGQARALHQEALAIRQRISHTFGITYSLNALAELAVIQGKAKQAVRLFGAIEVMYKRWEVGQPSKERAEHDHAIVAVRAQLDEATFNLIWAEGQKITMEQAAEFALEANDD